MCLWSHLHFTQVTSAPSHGSLASRGHKEEQKAAAACSAQFASECTRLLRLVVPGIDFARRDCAGQLSFQTPPFIQNTAECLQITMSVAEHFL